jgi:murein DD-endopeptidase MepM/ murein hydrolase activator NlpD
VLTRPGRRVAAGSGITTGVRRHLVLTALGVLIAAGVIVVTPSLLASSAAQPTGAVAQATATPPPDSHQPAGSAGGSTNPLSGSTGVMPAGLPAHGRPPLPTAPAPSTLTGYVWPLPNGRITNGFGPSWFGDNWVSGQRFHDGLDIATFCGDRIVAAHAGVVLAVGRKVDPVMGWIGSLAPSVTRRNTYNLWGELPIVIVIDDGNGYRSIYAHFSKTAVKVGDVINAGQFIGYEGRTGFATGCHLHYGLFSPYDTDRFGLRADVAKRTRLPAWEIARINPILVLPPRPAPGTPASPSPSPSPAADSVPPSGPLADPLVAAADQGPRGQPA